MRLFLFIILLTILSGCNLQGSERSYIISQKDKTEAVEK